MSIPTFVIKAAQHAAETKVDGKAGPKTLAALREYDQEHDEFKSPDVKSKLIVFVAQHAAGLRGDDLDGAYGPTTERVVREYVTENLGEAAVAAPTKKRSQWATWEPRTGPGIYNKDGVDLRDSALIIPDGGLSEIPNRKTMKGVYGDALGLGESGMKKRLVSLDSLPGRFNRGEGKLFDVHKLVAPHLALALDLCQRFGVIDEIYRIGVFNYRHMRHDPDMPLSFHSYGISVDLNSRENYGWSPQGDEKKIRPFTDGWQKKYPRGLSEVAVLCFKKAGWAWGGDWPSYRDPMHFELVRPR